MKRRRSDSRSFSERFWERVFVAENGCWEWRGTHNVGGYGIVRRGGRTGWNELAHRISFRITSGVTPPTGVGVLHRCDNPPCVHPGHLYLGGQRENIRDAKERNRLAVGVAHGQAKLTDDDVRVIRSSREPSSTLASRFGVAARTILDVRKRKTWTHVEGDRA